MNENRPEYSSHEDLLAAEDEMAIRNRTDPSLQEYDEGLGDFDSPERERAYMAGYLSAAKDALDLTDESEIPVFKSVSVLQDTDIVYVRKRIQELAEIAKSERSAHRESAGTGLHFPIYTVEEQVESRRLRGRHQGLELAGAAIDVLMSDWAEKWSKSMNEKPESVFDCDIEELAKQMLTQWHLAVAAWAHAGPTESDGYERYGYPPCPLEVAETMKLLIPGDNELPPDPPQPPQPPVSPPGTDPDEIAF